MTNLRVARGSEQFQLRLPDGLRHRIKSVADENGRSMNTEIVVALLERFPEIPAEAKAVVQMIEYVEGAEDDLEKATRAAKLEATLRLVNQRARVLTDAAGSIVIKLGD